MFFGMMAWTFARKGGRLSLLVALLMATICLESVKDLFFIDSGAFGIDFLWTVMTAVDMVAVPMYGFILMELVRPGELTLRRALFQEAPSSSCLSFSSPRAMRSSIISLLAGELCMALPSSSGP